MVGTASSVSEPLTKREMQVLLLICEGRSSKEIGANLGITFKTAVCHRSRLMQKLGVHEVASLVRYAVAQGMLVA
jgi:DNA-binding NarL/FixJ family response regulator